MDDAVAAVDHAPDVRGVVVIGTTITGRWNESTAERGPTTRPGALLVAAFQVHVGPAFNGDAMDRVRDAGGTARDWPSPTSPPPATGGSPRPRPAGRS